MEITLFRGRCRVWVRLPQHLAQAFHHMMLRRVLVGKAHEYLPVIPADTPRLVDRQLLLDGDVHAEMQERIGRCRRPASRGIRTSLYGSLIRFLEKIALARRLGMFEKRMIFGVPQDHLRDELFHALQRTPFAVRAPGAGKYLACLCSILTEEHSLEF